MDTDSFGKKWGSFKNEKRHKKITSHVKTPEMYTELVKTKLNCHPIQIIGKWCYRLPYSRKFSKGLIFENSRAFSKIFFEIAR